MSKFTFECKNCGTIKHFDTKEERNAYNSYHYLKDKKYPRLKACRNMVRTTHNTIMRVEAAHKIDEEIKKNQETLEMNWDEIQDKDPD